MAGTPPMFDQNLPFETGESVPLVGNESVNVANVGNLIGGEKLGELRGGASSNESENEESAGPSSGATAAPNRSNSPPPNCAICLSRCKDKCFTESCLHHFCFKCLCEWSKIKPECPLCKQAFKSIIHNVRAMGEFDRYHVQPNPQMPERPLTARFLWSDRPNVVVPQLRLPIIVNEPVMRNGAMDGDSARNMNSRYEPYRVELLNMYRQDRANGGTIIGSLSQLWRRYIYDRKLYALPVSDMATGQFRDWSARFYRSHPAQIHRLMPWINRDIVCLLRNTAHSVTEVMTLMNNILPLSNILGPTFRRQLSPYLGNQTSHFIHELFNFARSPYDMIGYDRVVQYSAQVAEEVTIDFSSSSDDERHANNNNNNENTNAGSNVTNNNSTNNRTEQRRPHWTGTVIVNNPNAGATHSLSVSLSTDGLVLPIRGSIQSTAMNLSIHSRDGDIIEIVDNELDADAAANAEVAAINNSSNSSSNQSRRHAGAEMPVTVHIELNSSDSETATEINSNRNSSGESSDCEFVLERKPPHLRTPELVSLNSETDSDCVFVDETKGLTKKEDTTKEKENIPHSKVVRDNEANLFMGASTSTGVCSNSGNNWRNLVKNSRKRSSSKRGKDGRRAKTRGEAKRKRKKKSLFSPDSSSTSSDSSSTDSDSNFTLPSSTSDSLSNEMRERRTSTRFSKGERSLRSKNKNNKSIETEKREKEQKQVTRKRRSTGKDENKKNEKRRKREVIFSNNDDASDTDSDEYKQSLYEYRNQQKLEKYKLHRQVGDTTTGDDSSSSISETSTGAMPWLKTELIEPTSADAELPIAGTTNSTQETLPLAECVDGNRTVADSSRLSSSGSSSSLTNSNSSSASSSNSSSASEAQNNRNSDGIEDKDDDEDDNFQEVELNRTDSSFNQDNERINGSLLDFTTDSMEQHGDDDDNANHGHDHDRSVIEVNTSSSRNSLSDDDNDDDDDNDNNDSDNESRHDVNDDDDVDDDGNGDNDDGNGSGNDDDDNDRSLLNNINTSTESYGNSLEEEARLPIYSDVSSDTSPPTRNRNIGEEAGTADIDVEGMDSFY